jgi:hypothetical protein
VNARLIGTGIGVAGTLAAAAAFALAGSDVLRQDKTSRARTVFTGKLPVLNGQRLAATVVEVTYPPGGANPVHRHPCPVIGYVLAGAMRMQLKSQNEKIFGPARRSLNHPPTCTPYRPTPARANPRGFSRTSCATGRQR